MKTLNYLMSMFFIILILIILMELISYCIIRSYRHFVPADNMNLDIYENQEWIKDYIKEDYELRNEFYPYTMWRRKPSFHGVFINTNGNSIRNTGNNCQGDFKIFMFGGSTMWGAGVPDNYTIPSFVSESLCEKGIKNEVTNFGEGGYVSTQELIQLETELQKGNIPDLVIFYDGMNDVESTYQNQFAGSIQNLNDRKLDFNARKRINLRQVILNSYSMKLISHVIKRPVKQINLYESMEDETLEVYYSNVKIVKSLAKEYNFTALFYWQPILATKESPSENEKSLPKDILFDNFYLNITRKLNHPDVRDLSNIFNQKETLYTDVCHLFIEGNEIIANEITNDIMEIKK